MPHSMPSEENPWRPEKTAWIQRPSHAAHKTQMPKGSKVQFQFYGKNLMEKHLSRSSTGNLPFPNLVAYDDQIQACFKTIKKKRAMQFHMK